KENNPEIKEEDLNWLGLNWDEGPYFQTQRLEFYKKYAQILLEKELAYPCWCSPSELAMKRECQQKSAQALIYSGKCRNLSKEEQKKLKSIKKNQVLRFKIPPGETKVNDLIRGKVVFENNLIDDFIILKSDGIPVYNFAAVVDDHLMKITHIIRGEEHLSNTPRQILLYRALDFPLPYFAHIPIILNPDRSKLSKRHGAVNLRDFKKRGFLQEALFNFLALLGWAPKDNKEFLTSQELIEEFSLVNVSKHPAIFNEEKLKWMNAQYIKRLSNQDLTHLSLPFFKENNPEIKEEDLIPLIPLYKERIKTLADFPKEAEYFFKEDFPPDKEAQDKYLSAPYLKEVLDSLILKLESLEEFNQENIESLIRERALFFNLKAGNLIHPLRVILTGKSVSPGLFLLMEKMGKEKVISRAKKFLNLVLNNHLAKDNK
ncbi:MAG: glutamate--tRNA ligase, partial [Armatimonadetes bacterium]|nr:glutamate--tRNA ligase [Armatimonadota bacterium]